MSYFDSLLSYTQEILLLIYVSSMIIVGVIWTAHSKELEHYIKNKFKIGNFKTGLVYLSVTIIFSITPILNTFVLLKVFNKNK